MESDASLLDGETFGSIGELPPHLADVLSKAAQTTAAVRLVFIESRVDPMHQSYTDLKTSAERILAGLRSNGLRAGDPVILQLDQPRQLLAAFWGSILGGMRPVVLSTAPTFDPSNRAAGHLRDVWRTLGSPLVLTCAHLVHPIATFAAAAKLRDLRLATMEDLSTYQPDTNWSPGQLDDIALLMLTSGSTAAPKLVMLTHRNMLVSVVGSANVNGYSEADISLNWLPLHHIGGLMRSLRETYLSCTQIQVATSLIANDPLYWIDLLTRYRVTITWAPNFAFSLVAGCRDQLAARGSWDLFALRSLFTSGEPVAPRSVFRFQEMLAPYGLKPEALHMAWGMTEACFATWSHTYFLDLQASTNRVPQVGRPIPGVAMRIVDDKDRVVPKGMVGHLQIRGPLVAAGYYGDLELQLSLRTNDGWLRTGDLGYLDEMNLTVTGRVSTRIIVNGVNYSSYEVEAVVEEISEIEASFTAACMVHEARTGEDRLAVFFHAPNVSGADLVLLMNKIRSELVRKLGIAPTYLVPLQRSAIPKSPVGKIQRSLLQKSFSQGAFDQLLRRYRDVDEAQTTPAHQAVNSDLASLLYIPSWKRSTSLEAGFSASEAKDRQLWLLFQDDLGLGTTVSAKLQRMGQTVVSVRVGDSFQKLDGHAYTVRPDHMQDYMELVADLNQLREASANILHLWGVADDSSEPLELSHVQSVLQRTFFSLLYLVQGVERCQSKPLARLGIVTSNAQEVTGLELLDPARHAVVGAARSATLELINTDCRTIDVEWPCANRQLADATAEQLIREMQESATDSVIALRGRYRWIQMFEPLATNERKEQAPALKQGGTYLITGGLGNVGMAIAEYLANRYQARLILVGRSSLPACDHWNEWIATHGEEDIRSQKIRRLRSLVATGSKVSTYAADVCDFRAMCAMVKQVLAEYGTIHGVIHAAGVRGFFRPLNEATDELATQILAPKVQGTLVLGEVLRDLPVDFLLLCSSLVAVTGRARQFDYASANAFQDAYAHARSRRGYNTVSVNWDTWRELPLVVEVHGTGPYAEIVQAQAEQGLRTQECYAALEHVLRLGVPQVVVTRRDIDERPKNRHSRAETIDEQNRAEPRTAREKQLAAIWRAVLQIERVGIHDNFFDLGGHSLNATQVMARIREELGIELPLNTLFEKPTVIGLAEQIEAHRQTFAREELSALLEEVESMSVEDVQRRLGEGASKLIKND